MLELLDVSKSFHGREVLSAVSLTVPAGRILCLTGPSGIGKSTLLEIMAGISPPDRGLVRRAAAPAFMFQDDALIPWLSCADNLAYIRPPGRTAAESGRLIEAWLGRFGLQPDQYPAALSGGMRRRLSLARTLYAGRRLILLDEPFAFLDQAWQEIAAAEVTRQAAEGAAVVLATHHQGFALDPQMLSHLVL